MSGGGSEQAVSPMPADWSPGGAPPAAPRPAVGRTTPASVEDDGRDDFRTLLRNLSWPSNNASRCVRTVALTSCYRGEGVSTVAAHSAVAAAGSGNYRVLLVDANVADAQAHRLFSLPAEPGLADVILGTRTDGPVVRRTAVAGLALLPAGRADPARVFEAVESWKTLVASVRREFDLAIFDMPAAGQGAAATHLFRLFDAAVLVVEDERVRWEAAQRITKLLRQSGANLRGAVLNKRHQHIPEWLYRRV